MNENESVFGSDEKVDKIVFRPLALDVNAKVRTLSDPPPRPLPRPVDDRDSKEWTPKTKNRKNSQEVFDSMQKLGNILKYVLFTTFTLAALAGLGYIVFWLMEQYNLGG